MSSRPTPDELIEDLREAARETYSAVHRDIPLGEILEWEAADFIEAALPILRGAADRGDDKAQAVLQGHYQIKRGDD